MFSKKEADFLFSEKVARMATLNSTTYFPHVVPICFAFDGNSIYTTLSVQSKRLKNIIADSKTSMLIDKYIEENNQWKILCGLLMYGDAKILTYPEDKEEFMHGWKLLIQKYPQYKQWADLDLTPKDPDKRRIIKFSPLKIIRWGFS